MTFLGVLVVHAALIIELLTWQAAPTNHGPALAVQLLVMPPARPVPVLWENWRPHPPSVDLPASVAAPSLDLSSVTTPASRSQGAGSAVDWRAEARRALQAYDIRSNRELDGNANPGMLAQDFSSRLQHHAGERYKTDAGDWIVWIDSNCYQIASASATSVAFGGALPLTVCKAHDDATSAD